MANRMTAWNQAQILLVAVVTISIAVNLLLYSATVYSAVTIKKSPKNEDSDTLSLAIRSYIFRRHVADEKFKRRRQTDAPLNHLLVRSSNVSDSRFFAVEDIKAYRQSNRSAYRETRKEQQSSKNNNNNNNNINRLQYATIAHPTAKSSISAHYNPTPTLSFPPSRTLVQAQKPDVSKMATHTSDHNEFDSERVVKLFSGCKADNDDLDIDCYNDAYEELCKIFKPLGAIFSFVTSDIIEKITILRDYRKSEVGDNYKTIQSMVKYEVDHKLTVQKKKASGCRTLLRLHRALHFISALLSKIRQTDNSCKFSHEVKEAYDKTLGHFHPWVIRKAVHVATYTLPDRQHMLIRMKVEDTPEGMESMGGLITQIDAVYNITEQLYASKDLLDLP